MTATEVRPRVRACELLPNQLRLIEAHDARRHKIIIFRGGYRSGKTWALCAKAIDLGLRHWPHPVLVVAPTFPLLAGVYVETMRRVCESYGMAFKWIETKKKMVIGDRHPITIYCRSAETRRAIEGISAASLIVDEWEMIDVEILKVAMARVSIGPAETQQIVLGGTPEGYGLGYQLLEKHPAETTTVIVCKTRDNPYLRESYVNDMRERFSDEEAREKLDGERSAPTGRTFTRFSRAVHCGHPCVTSGRLVWFAGFDPDLMAWVAVRLSADSRSMHVVGEIVSRNTDSQQQAIKAREWVIRDEAKRGHVVGHEHVRMMQIPVVCDASVQGGGASAGKVSMSHVHNLQEAGFKALYTRKNARYEDRRASLQKLLAQRRITFDAKAAEYVTRCIELQQHTTRAADLRSGLVQGEAALTNGVMWYAPAFRPANATVEMAREEAWTDVRNAVVKTRAEAEATLARRLESRFAVACPHNRAGHAVTDLGCTLAEFMQHIEQQWIAGMSWENWGQFGWQFDHIRPLSSFDLTDRAQFQKAAHFTNYQPLWAEDNNKKGNRWDGGA